MSVWVIECHSSASKSPWHDYVIHELKRGVFYQGGDPPVLVVKLWRTLQVARFLCLTRLVHWKNHEHSFHFGLYVTLFRCFNRFWFYVSERPTLRMLQQETSERRVNFLHFGFLFFSQLKLVLSLWSLRVVFLLFCIASKQQLRYVFFSKCVANVLLYAE